MHRISAALRVSAIFRWKRAAAGAVILGAVTWAAGPASAYEDLSGVWNNTQYQDSADPEIGDYLGIPLNDAGRLRADASDPELLTLPDYQCRVHPIDYAQEFGPIRMWEERDRQTQALVAIHVHIFAWGTESTIWMDGRAAPPPYWQHTSMGYSVGKWDGEILNVKVSNLKESFLRRNGLPRSDRAQVAEQFIRHGDNLTWIAYIQDPAYLTAPVIRSHDFVPMLNTQLPPYPCNSAVEVIYPKNYLPEYLPGTNVYIRQFADKYHLPLQAVRGVQAEVYPQYRKQIPALEQADRQDKRPVPSDVMGIPGSRVAVATEAAGDDGGADGKVHVVPVRSNVFMLVGPGGNVTVQTGNDGVLIVNSMSAQAAPQVFAAIQRLTTQPLRYIVDTDYLSDQTGGNALLHNAGRTVVGGNVTGLDVAEGAAIVAHQNVLLRMSAPTGEKAPTPQDAWPNDAYLGDSDKFYFNGEGVDIEHAEAASTDGDSFVYLRRSDVISTGEILDMAHYPVIELAAGGSIQGEIAALRRIAALMIPVYGQDGGTLAIPAHGRLCDLGDVVNYRDMLVIVTARVQRMIDRHMTLQQVIAARPTRDYDPLYGADTGPWTTTDFVSAVYRGLARGVGRKPRTVSNP